MKSEIAIYYLPSSIPSFNNVSALKTRIQDVFRRYTEADEVAVALCACETIPKGNEIKLAIKNGNIGSIDLLRKIEQEIHCCIVEDQHACRRYRITSQLDNSSQTVLPKGSDAIGDGAIMNERSEEFDIEKRAKSFVATDPVFSFDRVILSEEIKEKILHALSVYDYKKKVFEEWGLYTIEKHPSSALNFYGPSGTGKTMAAEAVATKLNKKILKVSYSDVESKYMGEGPKMVRAVFLAAKMADAVLFIDEADSLLSKRLTDISRNGDLEVNGMRSELLMQIEQFEGIAIFATNMISVYDPAVLTRLTCVQFEKPDADARRRIWDVHIKSEDGSIRIPLAADVDTVKLGANFEFSGREIRRAVISACLKAVEDGKSLVSQADFIYASEQIIEENKKLKEATTQASPEQLMAIKEVIKEKAKKKVAH